MYAYSVYGLSLHSAFPIPELWPRVSDRASSEADIAVREGNVAASSSEARNQTAVNAAASDPDPDDGFGDSWAERSPERRETLCVFAGVGRFLVRAGHTIIIEPAANADASLVRHLLLGPVLAHLLWQRDVFTLHASVVGVAGTYVAFVGASGEGKSTTAALFAARGQPLVCDDVAALVLDPPATDLHTYGEAAPWVDAREPAINVLPGFPRLRLYADSLRGLGEDPAGLAHVHAHIDKRSRPIAVFATAPVRLARLYVLASGDELALDPLPRRAALMEVLRHTYYAHQFAPLFGFEKHLQQAAQVVERVPAFRLTRPKDLARVGELLAFIAARSPN